ncbi:MAG: FAD/NAD(P)-binding protein [Bacteroidales bacterium]
MNGSIIIVGAGISGLATGCYARLNGYDSTIFEFHYHNINSQVEGTSEKLKTVPLKWPPPWA